MNRRSLIAAGSALAFLALDEPAHVVCAAPASPEEPMARVRRLAFELADAMNDYMGGRYYAAVYPSAGEDCPVKFTSVRSAEAEARIVPAAADPVYEAIAEWKRASDAYYGMDTDDGMSDEAMNALTNADAAASFRALTTVPATLAGLLAFCQFGNEAVRLNRLYFSGGLRDWTPGPNAEDAEGLFFATLTTAVRHLSHAEVC